MCCFFWHSIKEKRKFLKYEYNICQKVYLYLVFVNKDKEWWAVYLIQVINSAGNLKSFLFYVTPKTYSINQPLGDAKKMGNHLFT